MGIFASNPDTSADILRAQNRERGHLWQRTLMVGRYELVQTYNFALCEARTRAMAGLDDGMEAA